MNKWINGTQKPSCAATNESDSAVLKTGTSFNLLSKDVTINFKILL
jgi:hypothetical protein